MGKITKESWNYKGKAKFWHWIIFTLIYFLVLMYVSGMVGVYLEPIHLGNGHYIDIGVVILFLSVFIYLGLGRFIFKNIDRKNK